MIDGVFNRGDILSGGAQVPREILLVPEIEVGAVLSEDEGHQTLVGDDRLCCRVFFRLE